MKKYSEYELSELFEKIDKLLQKYFDKENDYDFYKKDDEIYKTDLTRRIYLMFLSNGDKVKIKITKSSLPHLFGINTEYLKSTGSYGSKGSYEIMLNFIKSPRNAIKMHNEGIIDLNRVLSPYINEKVDSLIDNLSINVNYCELVCKYDKEKTYCYSKEFDGMAYLILQKKNDKYYVLKLAKSNEDDNQYYPMSNQVFKSYDELIESLSSYLFNQECTLLNGLKLYYNNILSGNFYVQEWARREKLENLGTLSKILECVPNVLNDYIYSLRIRDDKRLQTINGSSIIEKLRECFEKGTPFDSEGQFVEEELSKLIDAYNDSLFKNVSEEVGKTYSNLNAENKELKVKLDEALHEITRLKDELNGLTEQFESVHGLYTDSESKLEEIRKILS